jgi:hypothetical protein
MQPSMALRARWAPSQRPGSGAIGGRRGARRCAQQQQQQEQQGAAEDLPDFQLPKFMPFTPHNALQRAMTSFRHWHTCPDGQTLLVMPLSAEHIRPAADLLTDSFAEAMAAMPYKNYLRRQVRQYLEAHALLPPKAVVLVALLLPPPDGGKPADAAAGCDSVGSSSSGSNGSGTNSTHSSSGSTSAAVASQQGEQQPRGGSPPEDGSLELGDGMAQHPLLNGAGLSDGSSADGAAAAAAGLSEAVLAGVVELSFSASTRSKHLTLTPPEVGGPQPARAVGAPPCAARHCTHRSAVLSLFARRRKRGGDAACAAPLAGPPLPLQHGRHRGAARARLRHRAAACRGGAGG